MISWITDYLAVASRFDINFEAFDTDTMFIDARIYFDANGEHPDMGMIYELCDTVRFQIDRYHRKFVVFCDAGIDRSPFVVANILEWYTKTSNYLRDTYKLIKEKRPCIIEHWEWIDND